MESINSDILLFYNLISFVIHYLVSLDIHQHPEEWGGMLNNVFGDVLSSQYINTKGCCDWGRSKTKMF